MKNIEVLSAFAAWSVLTIVVFFFARRKRTEQSSMYAGLTFLMLAVAGNLVIQTVFVSEMQCQVASCMSAKVMVDTFVQFLIITWGTLGGSLLAKTIENR